MADLIIGGTSGLGLELAKDFVEKGVKQVIVTGRHKPKADVGEYKEFDLIKPDLAKRIAAFVADLPEIKILVYAAGYFQEGRVTDLTDEEIEQMIDVGGRGLIYFVRAILAKQGSLKGLITITSTSQWTPRKLEPIYNFAKAGAAHFSNAMAEDGRIKKVLVAGPAGMRTEFWDGTTGHDLSTMMDPSWVSEQVIDQWQGDYTYRFVRILRQPPRVEQGETR